MHLHPKHIICQRPIFSSETATFIATIAVCMLECFIPSKENSSRSTRKREYKKSEK